MVDLREAIVPVESSSTAACPNCGAPPAGASFCPNCGQRNDRLRVTARALAADLAEGVFKVDRKVPSTARSLFVPGQLTIDHLQGRRARHLRPLSLFLFLAGLQYLAWFSTRKPADGFRFRSGLFEARVDFDGGVAGGDDAVRRTDDPAPGDVASGWLGPRFMERVAAHPERPLQALDALQSPKGQLAMVLAYVLGVSVAARRRRFLFSEHLVFVLHLQAFAALAGAAATLAGLPNGVAGVVCLFYDTVAFHRVYRFGAWGTTWRFAAAIVIASLVLIAMLSATVAAYVLW